MSEFLLTSYHFMEAYWTFQHLFCFNCAKDSTHDCTSGLACLAWQTSDVGFRSTVQLFSATCYCERSYSQSNQTSLFPLAILSLHDQQDDDIYSDPLTLGICVSHSTHGKHALTHVNTVMCTHTKSPHWISLSPPIHVLPNHVRQHALLLVPPSSYIYLVQTIPDCHMPDPRPGAIPSPLDSVWT